MEIYRIGLSELKNEASPALVVTSFMIDIIDTNQIL